jgi:hypothetical protein
MTPAKPAHWLLLIHQLPPKPDYFRVKIWRRLQGLGAAPVKNSVYVLPRSDQAVEDLRWVQREIEEGGGEASLCEAEFLDGLTDEEVIAAFRAARDSDYTALREEAERMAAEARKEKAAASGCGCTGAILIISTYWTRQTCAPSCKSRAPSSPACWARRPAGDTLGYSRGKLWPISAAVTG